MKFDDWCTANPDKAAKLRTRLGKKTFNKYRRESITRVDPVTVAVIVDVTKHQVTPNDFYGVDPIRAAKAAMERVAA